MKRARDPSDEEEEMDDARPAPKSAARRAMDGNFLTNRLNSIALGIDEHQHTVVINDITTRDEYPSEGGYLRDRRTGAIVKDTDLATKEVFQAYAPNVFEEEAERRKIVANHPDVRFSTLVTGFTHNPLTKYVDTESIGHSVRAEAEYKRIRDAQLKREASFAGDKAAELTEYLKFYERDTQLRQNALVALDDPNKLALGAGGLADLLTVLYPDGTPGFLFPFYMRWQYQLARRLIANAIGTNPALGGDDLAAVKLVVETDTKLEGRRLATREVTTARGYLMQCVNDFGTAGVPPEHQVIQLALVFYYYIVMRDARQNLLYRVGGRAIPINNGGMLTYCVLSALAKSIAAWPRITDTEREGLFSALRLDNVAGNLGSHYTDMEAVPQPPPLRTMKEFWAAHYETTHYNFFDIPTRVADGIPHAFNGHFLGDTFARKQTLFEAGLINVEAAAGATNRLFRFTLAGAERGANERTNAAGALLDLRQVLQDQYGIMTETLLHSILPSRADVLLEGANDKIKYVRRDTIEVPNLARYDYACRILEQLVSPVLLAALSRALPDAMLRPDIHNNYIYALSRGLVNATEKTYRAGLPAGINDNLVLPRDALNFYAATELLFESNKEQRRAVSMHPDAYEVDVFGTIDRFSKTQRTNLGSILLGAVPSNENGIFGATLARITAPLIFDGGFTRKLITFLTARPVAVTADGRFTLPLDRRDLDRVITAKTTTKNKAAAAPAAGVPQPASTETVTAVKESSSTMWLDIAGKMDTIQPGPAFTYLEAASGTTAGSIWNTTLPIATFFTFLSKMTPLTSVPLALDVIAHTARTAVSDDNLRLRDWKQLIDETRTALVTHASKKPLSSAELLASANRNLYLPTHAYQSAPHISGIMYFTPFFMAVLASGLVYARTTLGFRDVTLRAMTDSEKNPDLAVAFAAWIAAREAQSSLTHPKQYMKDRAYGAIATIKKDADVGLENALARYFRRADTGNRGGGYSSTYFSF